ncbi:endonuclease/exonuclease/phosphatase family protein [Planosporangium thailandense]|uniref:Endonuclease/exonuclease/phosphatase family protein n=1 Tax=Planosporangium thailandense TaxID=765197 RepID=A0ABX0XXB6_9ACTN|nr:endonuclease/exonuclease/phosphatase family protein [Planosporangium thailandense]NJC70481.1 endonuclease/exonuclease/phosphatase family protein [Planosporangium thailandense]
MALTVMTYNIKYGGRDGRLDSIIRVITAQRPDVLALEELAGFPRDGGRLMRRVADATGMRAFLARSRLGGQPVAVLVRQPAAVRSAGSIRRPFHHAAAEVTVATDRGPLTVIGTHLYPFSGGRRGWEAGWLASRADPGRMVLVMGDLNTLDPWTDHTDQLRTLAPHYRSRHLTRSGEVDTRAVRRLADAGFVDLFRAVGDRPGAQRHTVPTAHGGGQEFARMRLDYILGTPPVARLARSCRVVSGADCGDCETASDHYPLVATVDLTLVEPG